MDDAVIVQIADRAGQPEKPFAGQFARQSLRMAGEHSVQRFAGDVFHHDPFVAVIDPP